MDFSKNDSCMKVHEFWEKLAMHNLSTVKKSRMKQYHLHLVSDATGETINGVARACTAQFDSVAPIEHFWNLVRTDRQLDMVLEGVRDNPGVVMFTLMNREMRRRLKDACREMGVPCYPVLEPLIKSLASYLGEAPRNLPGLQHALNDEYFSRMEAMDFALSHDDGQSGGDLPEAEVILVGVSRTSKTPTCVYLANKGIKAANVPYVPGCPLPEGLFQNKTAFIVGLTNAPERLVAIRRNRLDVLHQFDQTSYVDLDRVKSEVQEARRLFAEKGWPIIDVSRRSIEETAAEILLLLRRRDMEVS